MRLSTRIFGLGLLAMAFLCAAGSAEAASFADYVYQNAKTGNIAGIKNYLRRGYSIDAVSPNGYTALCFAVDNNDYRAYSRIRNLGADETHSCMRRVNPDNAADLAQRYDAVAANSGRTAFAGGSDDTMKYVAAGAAVAGAATAVALWADDDGGSSSGGGNPCGTGEEFVDGECRPIECPEGSHLVGNECVVDGECPTGQKMVDGQCVPIVCPPNTHLQGNLCVADGDVVVDNENDDDLYGIYSEEEDVFNLYSSPNYPDDEASIVLKNKGNGNVYGVYGFGNVYNSYVIGEYEGKQNPKKEGTGNITITDEGSGSVYGVFSRVDDVTELKEGYNARAFYQGTAIGNIDITHTGGGSTFGIFGDVRAYNARADYGGNAYGSITIRGDGNIYGLSGYSTATNAVSAFLGHNVTGVIDLYSKGNGDVYGMMISKDDIPGVGQPDTGQKLANWFAFNAYASGGGDNVEGTINIKNEGDGDVYGMYGGEQLFNAMSYGGQDEEGNPDGKAKGTINIANYGNGNVYGMYTPEVYDGAEGEQQPIIANNSDNGAQSVINLVNTGSGVTTGLRGGQRSHIENTGEININNLGDGTAVGIYGGAGSNILNRGKINIYRQAHTDAEDGTVHNPDGATGGTAYGIYAESGAQVINSGDITITGAEKGTGIYLEKGASLENTGNISFNGTSDAIVEDGSAVDIYGEGTNRASVDLNDMGGEIILGQGGRFFADALSGDMSVSEKTVMGSFGDEYVLSGSLQAENINDLNLKSKSAMFEANSQKNENGGYDVVLNRKDFDELLTDGEMAELLENNYADENGSAIFDSLKQAGTKADLQGASDNLFGKDVLPNFRREDALVYRSLSRQFNDNLFNRPDENYIGGYKHIDISTDSDGTLEGSDGEVHAAYGMLKGQAGNGLVYGMGASIANLKSDYDNGSSRKSNIFGLWMPLGYDFGNGTRWYSKLYAGYADGSYDRLTALGKFSSDFTEYQYGLSNEVRHSMNLGYGFTFEPLAELNFLGIYQDGYDEGNAEGALHSDSGNALSLEGGLGAYLTKEIKFSEDSRLGIQIGGVYYVEFMDPDDGTDISLNGLNGKYKLRNVSDDNRTVFSARVNYNYKDIMLYGNIEQEAGGSDALLIDAGMQYKF